MLRNFAQTQDKLKAKVMGEEKKLQPFEHQRTDSDECAEPLSHAKCIAAVKKLKLMKKSSDFLSENMTGIVVVLGIFFILGVAYIESNRVINAIESRIDKFEKNINRRFDELDDNINKHMTSQKASLEISDKTCLMKKINCLKK